MSGFSSGTGKCISAEAWVIGTVHSVPVTFQYNSSCGKYSGESLLFSSVKKLIARSTSYVRWNVAGPVR